MMQSMYKKGVQVINYLARKKDGKINKMKAIKLVYLIDRFHIRKYGRPVIGDIYWAMKFGPVGSHTLQLANLAIEGEFLQYANKYIGHPIGDTKHQEIISKKEVDLEVFSQSDIEAIETIYKEFGDKDQFELADITHTYPEWSRHKIDIVEKGKKRVLMDYVDFFKDPKKSVSSVGIFAVSPEQLSLAKETYLEYKEVSQLLH